MEGVSLRDGVREKLEFCPWEERVSGGSVLISLKILDILNLEFVEWGGYNEDKTGDFKEFTCKLEASLEKQSRHSHLSFQLVASVRAPFSAPV